MLKMACSTVDGISGELLQLIYFYLGKLSSLYGLLLEQELYLLIPRSNTLHKFRVDREIFLFNHSVDTGAEARSVV
jgi:hypothetical protein